MPVLRMKMGESPNQSVVRQTPTNMIVLINIPIVVVIYEIVVNGFAKNDGYKRRQEKAEGNSTRSQCGNNINATG
jgi:hypothetical protein